MASPDGTHPSGRSGPGVLKGGPVVLPAPRSPSPQLMESTESWRLSPTTGNQRRPSRGSAGLPPPQ